MNSPIYPSIWCNNNALEVVNWYTSLFPNSTVISQNPASIEFELIGQRFIAIQGNDMYTLNPAISFFVTFNNIDQVEELWSKLSETGIPLMDLQEYPWSPQYGWIQDKFGLSWQLTCNFDFSEGQHISPKIMFIGNNAGKAWEAIEMYDRIFPNSSITVLNRYDEADGENTTFIKHAQFLLNKYRFMAMDSSFNHAFELNGGVSFFVECEDQIEIDYFWRELGSDGGVEMQCGWIKDKYAVHWQVIPQELKQLLNDPEKGHLVMERLLKMKKINIDELKL